MPPQELYLGYFQNKITYPLGYPNMLTNLFRLNVQLFHITFSKKVTNLLPTL